MRIRFGGGDLGRSAKRVKKNEPEFQANPEIFQSPQNSAGIALDENPAVMSKPVLTTR
jgi:hypothetical protein